MITLLSDTPGTGHGAERVLSLLLAEWAARIPDVPLRVVAPLDSLVLRTAQACGFPCLPVRIGQSKLIHSSRKILALCLKHLGPGDLVHAWTARTFEIAALARLAVGCECRGTLHDHPRAAFHSRARQGLMRLAAGRLQGLACVSQAVNDACQSAGYTCSLHTLRNGLPDLPPARARGPHRALRVGFLGSYAAWKGHELLAEWIRSSSGWPVEWHLFGQALPGFQGRVAECPGTEGRVFWRGHQPADSLFAGIDLLVHPSIAFDPYPTALLEAARAGVPAVATDVGGTREIVVHGQTGWLFDPDNPAEGLARLRDFVAHPDRIRDMGSRARERFSTHLAIEKTLEAYQAFWTRPQR